MAVRQPRSQWRILYFPGQNPGVLPPATGQAKTNWHTHVTLLPAFSYLPHHPMARSRTFHSKRAPPTHHEGDGRHRPTPLIGAIHTRREAEGPPDVSVGFFLRQPESRVQNSVIHVIVHHLHRHSVEVPKTVWPVKVDMQVEAPSTKVTQRQHEARSQIISPPGALDAGNCRGGAVRCRAAIQEPTAATALSAAAANPRFWEDQMLMRRTIASLRSVHDVLSGPMLPPVRLDGGRLRRSVFRYRQQTRLGRLPHHRLRPAPVRT